MNKPILVIVEDNQDMLQLLAELATTTGFQTKTFQQVEAANRFIHQSPPAVVLTDLRLPDGNGLDVLKTTKRASLDTLVVLITGYATVDDAIDGFKHGLYDLITKPFDIAQMSALLTRIFQQISHRKTMLKLQTRLSQVDHFQLTPVCQSTAIKQVYSLVEQVCQMDVPVLIEGETGVGKGVLARYIHQKSKRADETYLEINCAAVPENLIESELFGHEKGAFTGANARKLGLLELADGGTLLLDEINSMSQDAQAKLLHFLQNQTLIRVGGQNTIQVNVRLIFAGNQALQELVKQGQFRQDLYYRINVFPVLIPPLRQRPEDIRALAELFVVQFSKRFNKNVRYLSAEVLEQLKHYDWPGNIRELENIIQRAVVLASGETIELTHIPQELRPEPTDIQLRPGLVIKDNARLEEIEATWIEFTLQRCEGNKSKAARALGIDTSTLHRKLNRQKTK